LQFSEAPSAPGRLASCLPARSRQASRDITKGKSAPARDMQT